MLLRFVLRQRLVRSTALLRVAFRQRLVRSLPHPSCLRPCLQMEEFLRTQWDPWSLEETVRVQASELGRLERAQQPATKVGEWCGWVSEDEEEPARAEPKAAAMEPDDTAGSGAAGRRC